MPSSGVLIALTDALDVSVDYLVGDQGIVLEAVEFRKKKITSKREKTRVRSSSGICSNATSWLRRS